jgi:hypothetical protein
MGFILGLDLGQTQDFSALVAVETSVHRPPVLKEGWLCPAPAKYRYEVRGVRRWALRTAYTQIAKDVADLTAGRPLAGCALGVDKTGVGAGVLEIIRAAKPNATVVPVLITAGHEAKRAEDWTWHVPKLDLVAAVTAPLESGRLAIPEALGADGKTLGKELLAFRAKVTAAGNETAEADWRSRAHDDLVLALAIALWLGEQGYGGGPTMAGYQRRRPLVAPPGGGFRGVPWGAAEDGWEYDFDEQGRKIPSPTDLYGGQR